MELAERMQRTGSLYESDPQDQLLKAFQKRNHEKFLSIVLSGEANINHYYGDPHHGTILDLCTLQEESTQFLRTVLSNGADPNCINRMRKKAPLHFILEKNGLKNLSAFLECSGVDVNIVDSFGNTPLHYAAKGQKKGEVNDTTALQMLLNVPDINVNAVNRKGQTPAHLAVSQGNKNALLLLVRREDIDLEGSKDFSGNSALELIKEKYDDILIPDKSLFALPQTVTSEYIFSLLRANNTHMFKKALGQNKDLMNCCDGLYTLLQYACDHGLAEEATFLIQLGADVNKTNNSMQYTPLMLASRKGYQRIVQRLIKSNVDLSYSPVNMENVFHCVVMGSVEESHLGDSEEGKDHLECLNILLGFCNKLELINRADSKGNTPLHYAGRNGNDEMVFRLLEAGAYVGCINRFGDPALSYISPSVFERYLDKCVTTNKKLPREENYEIILNYKCFVPPKISRDSPQNYQQSPINSFNETDLLLYTCESPDFKPLLMHPVLKSLIYMKWFNIRKWFYVNLLFYLFFWAFITIYILAVYDAESHPNPLSLKSNDSNKTNLNSNPENGRERGSFLWYIVTLLLILFAARELFQLKKSYVQYLSNPENWMEMGLIVLTILILFVTVGEETKHQLAASAILFSWTELVLLIGKHPALSTHIEMLKTVGWNFLKFLAWYSILIVAFALSFYTLFRNGPKEDEENQVFIDPGISIFKTIVMLTGEFEAGEIPFERYPFTSHMLFVLFVFAIAIVLYNLLNGLAVSDTQAIKSDAEMVGYVSRIKLVSYVETIDFFSCKKLFDGLKSCNFSKGNLTGDTLSSDKSTFSFSVEHEIHIFPNDRNRIEFPSAPKRPKRNDDDPAKCCLMEPCKCKDTIMDSTIVKSAQMLLNKKIEGSESRVDLNRIIYNERLLDEFRKTLEEYKIVLKNLKDTEARLQSLSGSLKISDIIS